MRWGWGGEEGWRRRSVGLICRRWGRKRGRGGHSRESAAELGVRVERGKGRSAVSLLVSLACVQLWNIFKIIYTFLINSLNEMMR